MDTRLEKIKPLLLIRLVPEMDPIPALSSSKRVQHLRGSDWKRPNVWTHREPGLPRLARPDPIQRPQSPHVAPRGRPTMKPHPKRGAHIAAMQRKMQRNRDNRTSQPKEIHSHLTIHCTYKWSSAPSLPTIPLPGPKRLKPCPIPPTFERNRPGPYAISSPILLWVQQFAPSLHLSAFTRSENFRFIVARFIE